MLTAVLGSMNCVHDEHRQRRAVKVVRPTTLRLIEYVTAELIQSYFVGIDPNLPHPLNSYQIDSDNLVVQFHKGSENILNVEGANHVVFVVCNGGYPDAPVTRPLQMRCEGGLWKVEKFMDFLKPVIPSFHQGVGIEEMAREKRYRKAKGLQRAELAIEQPEITNPKGKGMSRKKKIVRVIGIASSGLRDKSSVHGRPNSKRICECFSLRKSLNPAGYDDERFECGVNEAAGPLQQSTIQTKYKALPLPPRDIHSFLSTCERQRVPNGVYTYWPRGPAGKSAVMHPDKAWIFQPNDIGCGVLLKFRMTGASFFRSRFDGWVQSVGFL